MRAQTYYMLSFDSTHAAMCAEQYLSARVRVCTMPTLRAVSASCGISLRVEEDGYEALAQAICESSGILEQARLYKVTQDGPELITAC